MARQNDDTATTRSGLISPNTQSLYYVTVDDLPLSCPMPGMDIWNSHPRVYLPVEETGKSTCPYCGAEYRLEKPPE